MGYERAMYFKKEAAPLSLSYFGLGGSGSKAGGFGFSKTGPSEIDGPVRVAQTNTFFQPPWWNEVQDEYFASRESVSLCDYSRLVYKGFSLTNVLSGFSQKFINCFLIILF